MGKLKERVLSVISDRSHTISEWRSRYSQRRQGMGLLGFVGENNTDTSRINGSVSDQVVPTVDNSELLRQLHASMEEIAVVDEVARILTSTLDIDQVYEQFAYEVKKLVDFDGVAINLIDHQARSFALQYTFGANIRGRGVGEAIPLENTATGYVASTALTLLREDVAANVNFSVDQALLDEGLRSTMRTPLISQGKVIGTIGLFSHQISAFGAREQVILERLAAQIAPAVENAWLYEQTRNAEKEAYERSEELSVLFDVASVLSKPGDFLDKATSVMELLAEVSEVEWATLRLPDQDGNLVLLVAAGSAIHTSPPMPVLSDRENLAYSAFQEGRPIVANDYPAGGKPSPAIIELGMKSMVLLPLKSGDQTLGLIDLVSRRTDHFTLELVKLLTAVADGVGVLLENARLSQELQANVAEAAAVGEVAKIICSTLDIDRVYEGFAAEVKTLMGADRVGINVVDHDAGVFTTKYLSGAGVSGIPIGSVRPLEGSDTGRVVATGQPLIRQDIAADPRLPGDQDRLEAGLCSSIRVPLITKTRVIGSLFLSSYQVKAYGQREQSILELLASQIAPAVENAQLYEQTQLAREQQQLSANENKALAEIGRIVSSSLDINEVYERLSEEVQKLIPFDRISVNIIDTTDGVTKPTYIAGTDVAGRRPGDTIPFAGTMSEEVARTRSPNMLVADSEAELRQRFPGLMPAYSAGLRSFLAVPLIDHDRVIGVLQIRSKTPGVYSQHHLDLAERIGNQIAGAIANAQLYEQTRLAEESERQRSEELGGLLEVSRILNQPGSFEDKVSRVMEELARICGADSAAFRVPDEAGLRRIESTGEQADGKIFVPYEGSIAGVVYERKETLVVNDYPNHPLAIADRVRRGFKSLFAAPIVSQESVVGVLIVNSYEPNHFTPGRVNLVLGIINGLGSLLENARLEDEREKAEQELRESERRFRQISENMREVVFLIDHQDYKVLYINDAFEEIWGQSCERIYENPMLWIDAVHPDDRGRVDAALNIQLSTGTFEEEFRIIRPDGNIRWILDRAFPILNETGEVYRSVGIAEDITERRETQERLQETARLASIGELAAGVAHEINNPLTSVLGYSEMLLTNKLSKELSGDIQTIYDEAQRAAKIVQNLLFFARKRNAEKQYLDVNSVLLRSLEMKTYDFKVSNIEVVSQLSPEIRRTMIDEHQLVQVFLNILTNAEQAIHKARAGGQIRVCTAISGDDIEITIKDNGPGISSEDLRRIFEPFFTTKEVGQGTGLGLSISFGIIKQHGGDIWAESVEGKGTTFHITLPVVIPEEIKVFQSPTPASNSNTSKHLLVVDDEPHIRDLLRKYLELERYTVDLAENGQEAWRKLQNIKYDCIVLDLKMPGMSGPELYRLIQGISEPLASKVVFITGDTVNAETSSFLDSASNPVLTKPFSITELEEQILEAVLKSDDLVPSTMPCGPSEQSNRQDMS